MQQNKLSITLASGPRACGKSTLLDFLYRLINAHGTIIGECSKIINCHIEKKTILGKELLLHKEKMETGGLIPPELAFEAVRQWINARTQTEKVHHILIGGCSRHPTESKLWLRSGVLVKEIHISQTFEETKSGILRRQKKSGIVRTDEQNEESVKNAWDSYNDSVLPAIKVFGSKALQLQRAHSMLDRLVKSIEFMDIPPKIKKRLFDALNRRSHPIRREVDMLDREDMEEKKIIPTSFRQGNSLPLNPYPHSISQR